MIETDRLKIIPLSSEQLLLYVNSDPGFEKQFELHSFPRFFTPELIQTLEHGIIPALKNPKKNWLFITLWVIILKKENRVVGDLFFKGEPDEKGEIEIGYSVYETHRNRGIMTEAVKGIISWAVLQKNIKAIKAETLNNNPGSMKVLFNNTFTIQQQKGGTIWLKRVL